MFNQTEVFFYTQIIRTTSDTHWDTQRYCLRAGVCKDNHCWSQIAYRPVVIFARANVIQDALWEAAKPATTGQMLLLMDGYTDVLAA